MQMGRGGEGVQHARALPGDSGCMPAFGGLARSFRYKQPALVLLFVFAGPDSRYLTLS